MLLPLDQELQIVLKNYIISGITMYDIAHASILIYMYIDAAKLTYIIFPFRQQYLEHQVAST